MTEFTFDGMTLTEALARLDKPIDRFDLDKKALRVTVKWLLSPKNVEIVNNATQAFEKVNSPIKRGKK